MISKPPKNEKPAFLTSREWEYVRALEKRDGIRFLAAEDLGVREHAIENTLTRIRKKIESIRIFNKRHGKTIERKYRGMK